MKKNNFFDLHRFFGLLKQDILFNYRFYLTFVSGLSIGIYLLSLLLIRHPVSYNTNYFTQHNYYSIESYLSSLNVYTGVSYISSFFLLYNFVLCIAIVFIGMSFPSFRNHRTIGYYLLIPGSAFEKMLVQFVVRFVLFIPLVMLLLQIGIRLAIASMVPDPKTGFDPLFIDKFSYGPFFLSSGEFINNPIRDLAYLFVAFAGAAYFERYAVVKTQLLLALFTVTLLLSFLITGEKDWLKSGSDFLGGAGFYFALSPVALGFFLLSFPWSYYTIKEKEL